ncbi:MAG: PfkB family carbohydrate kinase [Trebonia sp.]
MAVIGEALIDLVIDRDGKVAARPGGGPFTTARTLGRLGASPVYLGPLSGDGFGRLLRDRLRQDRVRLGMPTPTDVPTTLSAADVDDAGVANYRFYLTGTSAAAVDYPALSAALHGAAPHGGASQGGASHGGASHGGVRAVYTGALALAMAPVASAIERLVTRGLPPDTLLVVDPNCRPAAVTDRTAYLARLHRILRRADVVKASVDDLAYLAPHVPPDEAAHRLLDDGACLVLVTDGPRAARAFLPGIALHSEVPHVHVVDTIGAGDAFGGAFLAWWLRNGLTRDDLKDPAPVRRGLHAAAEVASLACTRPGADPPWLAELAGSSRWAAAYGHNIP